MTKTIATSTGSFDQKTTFTVALPPRKSFGQLKPRLPMTCYLFICKTEGAFALQKSVSIKSHYTDEDRAERTRLNAMDPLVDGEVVEIDGKPYRFKLQGDFSDAGRFIPA